MADAEERNEQLIKAKQALETEVAEMQERIDDEESSNEKLSGAKKKLEKQNEELSQDLESAEGNIKRLEKEKGVSFSCVYLLFILMSLFFQTKNLT